jgi:hypothetical protein
MAGGAVPARVVSEFLVLFLAAGAPDLLERAVPFVEEACGAKFDVPPKVLTLSEEEAVDAFTEDLRPQVVKLYPGARAGQIRAVLVASALGSARSCIARYSPARKAVLIVRTAFEAQAAALEVPEGEREMLLLASMAHETVHALDDLRFDLAGRFGGAADREALRAVSMVVEGRALFFGRIAAERLGVPEKIRGILPGGTSPEGGREVFLHLTYRAGADFIAALVRRGGRELADRALRDPPRLTHHVFHPESWPEGGVDPRPEALLRAAFPEASPQPLSELELRVRYGDLDGLAAGEELFAGYRGGAQALVEDTNAAVLAFVDEASAERFLLRSRREVPAERRGTLVLRAAGPSAAPLVTRLTSVTNPGSDPKPPK